MSNFVQRARFLLDHRWAPERMSAYLDGELPANGRTRLERHVGQCADCRGLFAGLRATLDALQRLPAPSGGADALLIAGAVRVRLREPSGS
jgi:anti-sigma factor RsiW